MFPIVIYESIRTRYVSAYPQPASRQKAQREFDNDTQCTIPSIFLAISRARYGPLLFQACYEEANGQEFNKVLDQILKELVSYDTNAELWKNGVSLYKIHHIIGDLDTISYISRNYNKVPLHAYMSWMRDIFMYGMFSHATHVLVSPLCKYAQAMDALLARSSEALAHIKMIESHLHEHVIYGGTLSDADFDKLFGSGTSLPASTCHLGSLVRICMWCNRYDVLHSIVHEGRQRLAARNLASNHELMDNSMAPVYRSMAYAMYIKSQATKIQRAWKLYQQRKLRIAIVRVCHELKVCPALIYTICTHARVC